MSKKAVDPAPQQVDLVPKALPTSERHQSETVHHDPTDTHQTPEAEAASRRAVAREKTADPGAAKS